MENEIRTIDCGLVCGRLAISLLEFVQRASQKDATPTEVEALPEVANVLYKILNDAVV